MFVSDAFLFSLFLFGFFIPNRNLIICSFHLSFVLPLEENKVIILFLNNIFIVTGKNAASKIEILLKANQEKYFRNKRYRINKLYI